MKDHCLSSDGISIEEATISDRDCWDGYVLGSTASSFFHRYDWSTLIKTVYGYHPYYLMARAGAKVKGVLPLIFVKSGITGRSLISTAFTIGGGVLADTPDIAQQLLDKAIEIAELNGVQYIELRNCQYQHHGWDIKADIYAGFEKPLLQDRDEMLKSIPKRRRAELRKAIKFAEQGELTVCREKDVGRFFALYALSLRNLGTPVFPRKFISCLLEYFNDHIEMITIKAGDIPVSSLISFYHAEKVMPYYVGARVEARKLRAFDYIYWHQMQLAVERDLKVFDFGRSKYGAGSFSYKTYWGIEPHALQYQYKLIKAKSVPNVNPDNPKFLLATKIWQRLPVPVATWGGAILARHFA